MRERFRAFAAKAVETTGSLGFFLGNLVGILIWVALGPVVGFSDSWQLWVNTPTTVVTYLISILLLYVGNRRDKESKLVHDELLRAIKDARTALIRVDEMADDELEDREAEIKAET